MQEVACRSIRNGGYGLAEDYGAGTKRYAAGGVGRLAPGGECWLSRLFLNACRQTLAEKQNVVLRCSPGCKPGAGCLRGAKPRIYSRFQCRRNPAYWIYKKK